MRNSAAFQPALPGTRAFAQVLAPLIEERRWCGWIAGAGLAHLVLAHISLPGFECAFRALTGVPCPGCGLSRATLSLIRGEWAEAFAAHAFAPVFLLMLSMIAVASVVPEPRRQEFARAIGSFERRTAFAPLLAVALLGYWWLRLR